MQIGGNDPVGQWESASVSRKRDSKGKEKVDEGKGKEEVESPSQRNVVSPKTAEKTQKWAKGALKEYKNEFVGEKDAIELRLNDLRQEIERLSQAVAKQKPTEGVFKNFPEQNDRRQLAEYKREYHLLDSKLKAMEGKAQVGSSQLQNRSWKTKLADSKFGQLVSGAFKRIGKAFDRSSIEYKENRLNFIQEKVNRLSGKELTTKDMTTLAGFTIELDKMSKDADNMKLKLNQDDKDYNSKFKRLDQFRDNAEELIGSIRNRY